MDFRQLETFVYVCKRKSFSKAAKELYISQPTVSNHIHSLEEELNATLLIRSSKNILLTKQGEILLDFAQRVLVDKSKLNDNFLQFSNKFTGVIDIASSTVPEIYIVPALIKNFSSIYPDSKFKIRHIDSLQVIEDLESKNYIFGFTGAKKKSSLLKFHKIANDELVVIDSKTNSLIKSKNSSISVNQITDIPFIAREEGSGSKFVFNTILFHNTEIKLNTIAEVETTFLIKKLVQLNIGISIVSKNCLTEEDYKNFYIYKIDEMPLNRELYFVYNINQHFSILEEKFKEMVLNEKFN